MHTGWKSRGQGSSDFAIIPGRGGQGFSDNIVLGGPLFWVLLYFLLKSLFEYMPGAPTLPPFPSLPLTPCVGLCALLSKNLELVELQRCSYSYELLCLLPYVTIRSKLIATRIHVGLLFKSKVKKRLI